MSHTTELPHAEIAARYQASAAVSALASEYGCDPKTIRKSLRAAGVYRTRYYSEVEKRVLVAKYLGGVTIQELADSQCVNYATMRENLENWGAVFRRAGPARTHALNERYFQQIDTEAQAYWLGFMFADGSVVRRTVQLELARRDKAHITRFAAAVGYSGPIVDSVKVKYGREYPAAFVHIGCAVMCRDLANMGCVPRKTYAEELLPPTIDPALLRHFYRGYFDGDGSLIKHPAQTSWTFELIGHPVFIAAAQDWLCDTFDLNYTQLVHPRHTDHVRILRYQGARQVRKILSHLYAGASIFLPRKHSRYLTLSA